MAFGSITDELVAQPDKPLDGDNLGDGSTTATVVTSSEFQLGNDQASTELVVNTPTGFTVAATKTLVIKLFYSETPGVVTSGSPDDSIKLLSETGETVYAADAELARVIPESNIGSYCKLVVTNGSDIAGATVEAQIINVSG